MPIYSYLCGNCGYEFDSIRNSSEQLQHDVCRCGSIADKLPSLPGSHVGNMGPASTARRNKRSNTSKPLVFKKVSE